MHIQCGSSFFGSNVIIFNSFQFEVYSKLYHISCSQMCNVEGQESKNTDRWAKDSIVCTDLKKHFQHTLGKIWATFCKYRKTITPENPEDTYALSGGRDPTLEAVKHKSRMRRKICHQTRKERRQIKHLSSPHSILCTHLAGRINEDMAHE